MPHSIIRLPGGSGIVAPTDAAHPERRMIRIDDRSPAIFASDGSTIQRLHLHTQADGSPILADDVGATVAPWEIELLRWPPEAEAALKRGGYLPVRPHSPALWCNCID